MRNERTVAEVDRRSWAAYVVGHHAQTLRLRQEMRWTIVTWPAPAAGEEDGVGFGAELDEMRRALRVLAVADQVRPGVLVELHRALDGLAAIFREMPRSQPPSTPDATSPPGAEEWEEAVTLAGHLLGPTADLLAWSQLGALVGRCRLRLRMQPKINLGDLAQEMGELPGLVAELGAAQKYPFLREVAALASAVSTEDDEAGRYLEFARVDLHVLSALRNQVAPEPLLVLDRDRLVLFGESLPLADQSEHQIFCLWVLAERAGKSVDVKTIMDEGNFDLDSPANSMKSIVSRLRDDVLRPLISQYRRREGGLPLDGEDMGFIRSVSQGRNTYEWGRYLLQIDPARVRVIGPRPKGMK